MLYVSFGIQKGSFSTAGDPEAFEAVSVPWMVLEAAAGDPRGCYFTFLGL
jgi:hypothetical protein